MRNDAARATSRGPWRIAVLAIAPMVVACAGAGHTDPSDDGLYLPAPALDAGTHPPPSDGSAEADAPVHRRGVGEQQSGACPAAPQTLRGTAGPGDRCTTHEDCAPTCCTCPATPGEHWLGASCDEGRCVSAADACSNSYLSSYCRAPLTLPDAGALLDASSGNALDASMGGGPPTCAPGSTDCDACVAASCCAELDACESSDTCLRLAGCIQACAPSDDTCVAACDLLFPAASTYGALLSCASSWCPDVCN